MDLTVNELGHRGDGRLRILAPSPQRHRLAASHAQGHHGDRTARIDPPPTDQDRRLGGEALGRRRHLSRRPRVQSVSEGDDDRPLGLTASGRVRFGGLQRAGEPHHVLAQFNQTVGQAPGHQERVAVGDDNRRQQALRPGRKQVHVEADQWVSRSYGLSGGDKRGETLARERHGLQANVHQHLGALRRAQADRVPGRRNMDDDPVAGRVQGVARGVDSQAVAQHPTGEHGIRRLIQGADPALQRRFEDYGGQD